MTSLLGSSLSFLQVSAQHFFTQASSKPPLGRWELSYRNIPRKKTRANPTPADLITWSHPDLILFGTLLPHPQGARLLLIIISPPQEPPEAHPPSWSQAYETTKKKKQLQLAVEGLTPSFVGSTHHITFVGPETGKGAGFPPFCLISWPKKRLRSFSLSTKWKIPKVE